MNIDIEKLEIKIKDFHLLCENLCFREGDVILLEAPNGSGKSMFLKGITGLVKTVERKIRINGEDSNRLNLSDFIGAYLGEDFLIPFYSPAEYFQILAKIKGLDQSEVKQKKEIVSDLFKQKWPNKYIRDLSTGMKKKVGLVASLIGSPKIILWDEPFENIDDEGQALLKEFIKSEKRTLVYSSAVSNDYHFTKRLFIDNGKVIDKKVY